MKTLRKEMSYHVYDMAELEFLQSSSLALTNNVMLYGVVSQRQIYFRSYLTR